MKRRIPAQDQIASRERHRRSGASGPVGQRRWSRQSGGDTRGSAPNQSRNSRCATARPSQPNNIRVCARGDVAFAQKSRPTESVNPGSRMFQAGSKSRRRDTDCSKFARFPESFWAACQLTHIETVTDYRTGQPKSGRMAGETLKTLNKALLILRAFDRASPELTVAEIARGVRRIAHRRDTRARHP